MGRRAGISSVSPPPTRTTRTPRSFGSCAYAQLPNDRGVLVVLVGGGLTLDMPARLPMLSWLFSALFGEFQSTFNVMPYDPESTEAGPSFRDRLVHSTKHRRIGCVAAL